jgi:photosystem II stability/assembly factor-like uncharacterized protein
MLTSSAMAQGWQVVNFPTADNLTGIAFTSPDTGYVITRSGNIARTTNGGKSWGGVELAKTALEDIYFSDSRTAYVCGAAGRIFKSKDAGRDWTDHSLSDTSITLLSIRKLPSQIILATGLTHDSASRNVGVLMRSTDDGHSWTRLPVKGMGFGELLVTPDNTARFCSWGFLYTSNDLGVTWTAIKLPDGKPGRTIDIRGNTGIMVGNFAQVATSSDRGKTWTQVSLPKEEAHFTSALLLDEKKGWIAGSTSKLYFTADGGHTWNRESLPIACEIIALTKSGNRIWAVGNKGAMIWKQIK